MKNHWLLTAIILISQLGAPAVRAGAVRMCPVEVIATSCDESEAIFCEIGGVEPASDLGGIDAVAPPAGGIGGPTGAGGTGWGLAGLGGAGGIGGAIAALLGGSSSSTPSSPQTANASTTASSTSTGATTSSTSSNSLSSEEPVKAVPAPPAFIGLLVFGVLTWVRSRRSKSQNQSNSATER